MTNIKNIDLNLLVVFVALCEEKNTTKAAERLGLSQPAVSHALSRLRGHLQDPLFVRASKGITPTPRALELQEQVSELLSRLDQVLMGSVDFNPAVAEHTFKIATTDYFEQIVLPYVLKALEKEAPLVRLVSRPTLGHLPKDELENGTFDLAIAGFYGELPESFLKQKVFEDDFVCVSQKGHSRVKKKSLTMEQFAKERHIMISPQGDMKSRAMDIVTKKGYQPRMVAGISSFLSPGWIVSETDSLLTCPRKLAQSYQKYLPLDLHELPFEMPKIQVVQVWHERNHKQAAHTWFRQLISRLCKDL